jgi:predicted ATPase
MGISPRMISPKHFIKDNAREDIIKEIRDCINNSFQVNQSLSIRLRGLPGIGKTRLVLEALEPDNIKNMVIYFNDGNT